MDYLLKNGRTWSSWKELKIEAELVLLDCGKTLVMGKLGCNGTRKVVQCSGRGPTGSTSQSCLFQLVFSAVRNKDDKDGLRKDKKFTWHFVRNSALK